LGLEAPLEGHIAYGFYRAGHVIYSNPAALAQFQTTSSVYRKTRRTFATAAPVEWQEPEAG
jgi:hypothetical protein